jgi:hypothetical protein
VAVAGSKTRRRAKPLAPNEAVGKLGKAPNEAIGPCATPNEAIGKLGKAPNETSSRGGSGAGDARKFCQTRKGAAILSGEVVGQALA